MTFDIDEYVPASVVVHERARPLLTDATERLFEDELGPLGSDAGSDALTAYVDWREENRRAKLSRLFREILENFEVTYRPSALTDAVLEKQTTDPDEDFDFYESIYRVDETVIASGLAQILVEGGLDDSGRATLAFALARQSHPLVLARLYQDEAIGTSRLQALKEAERLFSIAGPPSVPKTSRRKQPKSPSFPWPVGSILRHRLPQGRTIFLHLFSILGHGDPVPWFYVLDWDEAELPADQDALEALQAKPSDASWKFTLAPPPLQPGEDERAWRDRVSSVLAPTGRSMPSHREGNGPFVPWDELDGHLLRHWRWPDVTPPPARPLSTERVANGDLPAGPLQAIGSAEIIPPTARIDAPETDPERRLKETLIGGERAGGILVSKAGPGADAACAAWVFRLWQEGFQLPGRGHVELATTTHLAFGACEIGSTPRSLSVRIGIDPDRMRAICRGTDPVEGIDWLGAAFTAIASRFELDPTPIERARKQLHEHGVYFEVPLSRAKDGDVELVAYAALRPKAAPELVLEHRTKEGVLRGVVPGKGAHPLWAGELKLVNGVVQLAPKTRSMGLPVRLAVSKMSPSERA